MFKLIGIMTDFKPTDHTEFLTVYKLEIFNSKIGYISIYYISLTTADRENLTRFPQNVAS